MERIHRYALLGLVLALLVAGCTDAGGVYAMSDREQQLKQETIGSLESVDNYRVAGDLSVSGDGRSIQGDIRGVIDRSERRARVEVDVSGATSLESTTYIVNDTAHVHTRNTWRTVDISDRNLWERNERLERQQEILEGAQFEVVGNDTVDGHPVRVVEIHVAKDKLDDLVSLAGAGDSSDVTITEATYTSYIDTETNRLRRVSVDMTMELDGERLDAAVTQTFSDFEENVTIEIPEQARDGVPATAGSAPRASTNR